MINDGRRLEKFFEKNGIGQQYVKNINDIKMKDEKIANDYKEWLLQVEEPKIRDRIREAIENDFLTGTINKECYKCRLELHNELFNMYESLIVNTATEREYLEYLKAYT